MTGDAVFLWAFADGDEYGISDPYGTEVAEFRFMEINPRFWRSLALAVASGVDFPYRYYRLANGDVDAGADSAYETGGGCHVLHGG